MRFTTQQKLLCSFVIYQSLRNLQTDFVEFQRLKKYRNLLTPYDFYIMLAVVFYCFLVNNFVSFAKMAKKKNYQQNRNIVHKSNFWGMVGNVLVQSINKGQLPIAGVILIIITIIFKLPSERVYDLVKQLIDIATVYQIGGWILFGISIFGWIISSKSLRRNHTQEIRRLSTERTKLQEKLLNKELPSSN